jgi:hypothetical protein
MNTTQTRIQKISYETSECTRCGGEGRINAFGHVHGGTCFGCNGAGHLMTRKGKAAYQKVQAWKAENTTVALTDIVPGDRIYVQNMRGARVAVTVISVTQKDEGTAYIVNGETVYPISLLTVDSRGNETSRGHRPGSATTYQRVLTQDDLQTLAGVVARMSGATVIRDEA